LHGIYCHQHQKTERGLRITDSTLPGAGDGLFTTKPIKKGAVICEYTGDRVVETDPNYENPYALEIKERPPTFIDSSKTNEPGEGRWVNDPRGPGKNASLDYDEKTKRAVVTALRDIEPGEEILVDYGEEYPWREPSVRKKAVVPKRRTVSPAPVVPKKKLVKPAYDPKWDEEPVIVPQQQPWLLPQDVPDAPAPKQQNASPPQRTTWTAEEKLELELLSELMALQDLFEDEKLAHELKIQVSKRQIKFPKRDPKRPDRYFTALGQQVKKEKQAWIAYVNQNPRTAMTAKRADAILAKAAKIKAAEIRKSIAAAKRRNAA
jgi:hypothetical protein